MVSTSSHARRYDMPSALAAAVIEPVPAIASSKSTLPGPTAMSAPLVMRRRNCVTGAERLAAATSLDRHGLRQIARLVDVGSAQHCGVIRQQLQRHDVHHR